MKGYFRLIRNNLAEAAPQIGVAVVLFVGAGVFGALDDRMGAQALEAFRGIAQGLMEKDLASLILAIFLRNSVAAGLAVLGGAVFGLLPLAAILFNGVLFGTVLRLYAGEFWKVVPHGIFEIPAMFIAWGLGLWVGVGPMAPPRWRRLKERLNRSLRVYVLLILPLLAVAALVEGIAAHLFRG